MIGGAILGLFNLIVRPLALILSLPLLILTLGLFYFVLNGILYPHGAAIPPGAVATYGDIAALGSTPAEARER